MKMTILDLLRYPLSNEVSIAEFKALPRYVKDEYFILDKAPLLPQGDEVRKRLIKLLLEYDQNIEYIYDKKTDDIWYNCKYVE
jgi:hypothetical protein